jgi:hypothetical protein
MPGVEKVNSSKLSNFHGSIEAAFRSCLDLHLRIVPKNEHFDWEAALPGTIVFFEAKPSSSLIEAQHLADRTIVFLFAELPNGVPLYVAWGEQWVKNPTRGTDREPSLALVGVSAQFYIGSTPRIKTQLIRAEWDNPMRRGNDAAQPHWHIDPNVIDIPFWAPSHSTGSEQLEELPATSNEDMGGPSFWAAQRLHLGMGGWLHFSDNPRCWQHAIEPASITIWLERVLTYCKVELPRVTGRQ